MFSIKLPYGSVREFERAPTGGTSRRLSGRGSQAALRRASTASARLSDFEGYAVSPRHQPDEADALELFRHDSQLLAGRRRLFPAPRSPSARDRGRFLYYFAPAPGAARLHE